MEVDVVEARGVWFEADCLADDEGDGGMRSSTWCRNAMSRARGVEEAMEVDAEGPVSLSTVSEVCQKSKFLQVKDFCCERKQMPRIGVNR